MKKLLIVTLLTSVAFAGEASWGGFSYDELPSFIPKPAGTEGTSLLWMLHLQTDPAVKCTHVKFNVKLDGNPFFETIVETKDTVRSSFEGPATKDGDRFAFQTDVVKLRDLRLVTVSTQCLAPSDIEVEATKIQ